MEPQWNPALEEQALDRIYRIGQTQPVTTVRFIIENSFEQVRRTRYYHDSINGCQNVMSLQSRKRELADLALSTEPLKQGDLSSGRLQVRRCVDLYSRSSLS
jgi:SNF2 family DNA or RNA helicase